MALDFLNSVGPLAQGIGGLMDAFNVGKPKIDYGPTPSEAMAHSLFQALLDPNNSLVKQNTDINMRKGMQDLLMQLMQMQRIGNRAQARGLRSAFFSPDRADETLDYLLSRGQAGIADRARQKTIDDIRSTANSLSDLVQGERDRINDQAFNRQTDWDNFKLKGGYGGMAGSLTGGVQDLLNRLFGGQANRPNTSFVGPMPYQGGIL